MTYRNALLLGVLGAVATWWVVTTFIAPHQNPSKERLTFSNTAQWDPTFLALTETPLTYKDAALLHIELPPPPSNTSSTTLLELAILRERIPLRTPEKLQEIQDENDLHTLYLAGHVFTDYIDSSMFPATALLLQDSFNDLTALTMREKKRFDRVRPSALDTRITTTLPVPGHPAYPSGHSTQAHYLAYVFSELAPAQRETFLEKADQIARNRELAGLHYPSDTEAGKLLAQQFFTIMMQQEKFLSLLEAAKKEWVAKGLTQAGASH